MSKRVLIVTEEWAGGGHMMASVALKQALQEYAPDSDVSIVGGLGKISPALREASRFSYANSIRYFPRLWQQIYDREKMWSKTLTKPMGKLFGRRLLHEVIEQLQPDAVVATHACCLSALCEAKRFASKPYRVSAVFTDFHINQLWLHEQVDAYVVAHDELGRQLVEKHGVEEAKVFAYGIPLRTAFAKISSAAKNDWRTKLGLRPDLFTILISGGSGGLGEIGKVVNRLLRITKPLQIVVITGQNRKLYHSLSGEYASADSHHQLHFLEYVDAIWEWIGAADAYITKAGGLSCSEALAMRTPIILYRPLPGQEQHNAQFLRAHRAAVEAETVEEVAAIINDWQEREFWETDGVRLNDLGRPDSAYRSAELILNL